jgi:hypothetical protein
MDYNDSTVGKCTGARSTSIDNSATSKRLGARRNPSSGYPFLDSF